MPIILKTALLAPVVVAALAGGPQPRVDLQGFGDHTTVDAGAVTFTGSAAGRPFDGDYTGTLQATDGSFPAPGDCEPATATMRLDGRRDRFLELVVDGTVCGHWLQPPTSVVTQAFTGRYEVTASSARRLVGTDGFFEVRLADDGRAGTTAIDT